MRAQEILNRGIQKTEYKDKTFSKTGKPDFQPEEPEILTMNPKGPYSRPRTKASTNNSYT